MLVLSSMWLSLATLAAEPSAPPFDARAALSETAGHTPDLGEDRAAADWQRSVQQNVDPAQAAFDRSSRRMSIFMISAGAALTTLGALNVYEATHAAAADVQPGTKEFGIMGLVCGPIAIAVGVGIWPRRTGAAD